MCSVRTAILLGSFVDLTSSIILETQKGAKFRPRLKGVGILARPQSGGKLGKMGAIYLTAIFGVADNKGLFWGSGKSPRLNQFGLPWLPKGLWSRRSSHEKSIWLWFVSDRAGVVHHQRRLAAAQRNHSPLSPEQFSTIAATRFRARSCRWCVKA